MSAEQSRPIRTFIYGSCVSRDTFEFLRPFGYELVEYIARQSLISAFGPPAAGADDHSRLTSSFQRRMLAGDEQSSLPIALREHAATTDLLLLDLVDERLGVLPQGDGFYTDSVERRALQDESRADCLKMGSARHRALFTSAVGDLARLLDELSLRKRTAVLAPRWAENVRSGGEPPESFGLSAADMNPLFDEYVEILAERAGLEVLGADISVAAEPDHRWGLAPFHYDDETYTVLAEEIDRFTTAHVGSGPRPCRTQSPVATLRNPDSPPIVTLREIPPGEIAATVRTAGRHSYAFHLYAAGEVIEKAHYSRSPTHIFNVRGLGRGPFYVRAFIRDGHGQRLAVTSERIHLTR